MYRQFARLYGWLPEQVNRLTPYQASLLLGAYGPEDGRVSLTPAEYAQMFGSGKQGANP